MRSFQRAAVKAIPLARAKVSSSRGLSTAAQQSLTTERAFGQHVFRGAVAAPYLEKAGLPSNVLDSAAWAQDARAADQVAAALLAWAQDNGASVFCHWFQPLGASGFRHGMSAQVHQTMIEFDGAGLPMWTFKGKHLLRGETDGSSFPNGGLRATHTAGAYLSVDPTSPPFLRGDTVFVPSCMVSYHGHALDEKTPLLRASDALSREGVRLLSLLGMRDVRGLQADVGLEQEFFLVPRPAYLRRVDLQLAGRTVIGNQPPRSQEISDHYMAPPSLASPALACMQEVQDACFKLGIPLRTRHREVAPNQYEFAPMFGSVTTQVDQNLVVMQVIDEVASQFGLAALFQEKPFQGANGSGKHNNWSLSTDTGVHLLNPGMLAEKAQSHEIFPVIMAAIVKAVDVHGDLLRMAIATPGNDFRLGACEAPPAILSTYLGDAMTEYLKAYSQGAAATPYVAKSRTLSLGASVLPPLQVPSEDRNRTSPMPYGGNRFELRAVGSSQNVSTVNMVLASITASVFKEFSDAIESGARPKDVAQKALKEHWRVIFNGNGYDPANQAALTAAGVCRIDSGVEAMCRYSAEKNIKLFSDLKVLSPEECRARQTVSLRQYVNLVEIEAKCMIDMIRQNVIPSLKAAQVGPVVALSNAVDSIQAALSAIHAAESDYSKATLARTLRLEEMLRIREVCDEAEAVCPAHLWTLATYKELQFLDQTTAGF